MQGDNARTCGGDGSGVDGVWSSSAPVCIGRVLFPLYALFHVNLLYLIPPLAFSCPKLSAPENGVVTNSANAVGFVKRADYECDPGFQKAGGDAMRTCVSASGSSGEWTGTAPTCQGNF